MHMKPCFAKMTAREVSEFLKTADNLTECLELLEVDQRASVRKLAERVRHYIQEQEQGRLRTRKMYRYQQWLTARRGIPIVIGVDEVGRGPLAGPVVAAAVVLPLEPMIVGLDDSKRLTDTQRRKLVEEIYKNAVCLGIGQSSAAEIDQTNIREAAFAAMRRAVGMCHAPLDALVIVDGRDEIPNLGMRQRAVIKGDARVAAVAAASIVAKVYRDDLMMELDKRYPQYGFAAHKGYPTPEHLTALQRYGLTPEHRTSFSPCHALLGSVNF